GQNSKLSPKPEAHVARRLVLSPGETLFVNLARSRQ
ncbi:hypothetical protein A2U01_0081501, partial [Trifolium medium]|nr:hypothetical protein [Trifolium medium]